MDVDRVRGPTFMQWFRGETVLFREYLGVDVERSNLNDKVRELEQQLEIKSCLVQSSIEAKDRMFEKVRPLEEEIGKLKGQLGVANSRVQSLSRVVEDLRKRSPEQENRTRSRVATIREILDCLESDLYDYWNFQDVEGAQCSDGN